MGVRETILISKNELESLYRAEQSLTQEVIELKQLLLLLLEAQGGRFTVSENKLVHMDYKKKHFQRDRDFISGDLVFTVAAENFDSKKRVTQKEGRE